jgi:hypothetical protein
MSLENDLREAMRRVPAPEGFAERVRAVILSRADDEGSQPRRSFASLRMTGQWWRAAAATFLLAAILGGWGAHETIRRREGERAREQVLLALRIAGTHVARAQAEAREHMAR